MCTSFFTSPFVTEHLITIKHTSLSRRWDVRSMRVRDKRTAAAQLKRSGEEKGRCLDYGAETTQPCSSFTNNFCSIITIVMTMIRFYLNVSDVTNSHRRPNENETYKWTPLVMAERRIKFDGIKGKWFARTPNGESQSSRSIPSCRPCNWNAPEKTYPSSSGRAAEHFNLWMGAGIIWLEWPAWDSDRYTFVHWS